MYSITQEIENPEFNGWLNPEILLKNNRRQAGNRKRGYDLANIDLNEECDDIRRRVLRPRHDPIVENSQDASRTRPIRSNRIRQLYNEHINNHTTPVEIRNEPVCPPPNAATVPELAFSQSTTDMSLLQALAAYNWSQNYLVPAATAAVTPAQTDASFLHRMQHSHQTTYHPNMTHTIPQFDPWVLHNYLLAASYNAASTSSHAPTDMAAPSNDNAALRMSQMAYSNMTPEMNRTNALLWQYPFFLNQSISSVPNQPNRTPQQELHTHSLGPTHIEPNSDLSLYLRFIDYSNRESISSSNDARLFQGIYSNDPRISNYCNPMLPNPFAYCSICPYHSAGHLLHTPNQSTANHTGSGSAQSEQATSQSQNSFNSFPHSSASFDHFWPYMTPAIRPSNFPITGSNIDTLLHLAAHFEQKKRGITREELDKLPTHRYKATPDKQKSKDKNSISDAKTNLSEDVLKCLVCLEDFEPKQNIRVLRCDHEFHAKCIDKWLKINRTCPLCRADAFDGSAQKDGA